MYAIQENSVQTKEVGAAWEERQCQNKMESLSYILCSDMQAKSPT